jgi:hypothetical protein
VKNIKVKTAKISIPCYENYFVGIPYLEESEAMIKLCQLSTISPTIKI